jgi:hypothetical protein
MDDDSHNIIATVRPLLSRQKRYNSDGGENYNIATNVATSGTYNIVANILKSRSYNIAKKVAISRSYNIAATAMRVAATDIREICRWPAALQLL